MFNIKNQAMYIMHTGRKDKDMSYWRVFDEDGNFGFQIEATDAAISKYALECSYSFIELDTLMAIQAKALEKHKDKPPRYVWQFSRENSFTFH